ncbi:MAG: formate dehydrogenase accessory sulfurtransferase FdhD [Kangiellaceae bacterium]|nr:formate dehydrogenase accessory sulfurtransferase FdhD [Kangiellaceae bacterium]
MKQNQLTINRFRVSHEKSQLESDVIAVEEPLQILLEQKNETHAFSITMRTPGNDVPLIYGLLFCEGVIRSAADILSIDTADFKGEMQANIVTVKLSDNAILDLTNQMRSHPSYSGCGFCGKTSLKALELKSSRNLRAVKTSINNFLIKQLRELLERQNLFSNTGGSHVAGLIYEVDGMLDLKTSPFFEDVGRHNALDKLIGLELQQNDLTQPGILLLSGRIGFELVQKAIVAGFSTIVALGAPSSLAIQAAKQFDITLIGFAKDSSFNLYTTDDDHLFDIEHN